MKDQVIILPKGGCIARLSAFLLTLLPKQDLQVTIGDVKTPRSSLQNRALWGVAYKTLYEATGNDPEDLHAYFCGEFFGWQEYEVMCQRRKRPVRTTTTDENGSRDVISTVQLSAFYAFIQQRSAETVGVFVPDPDPRWWHHKHEQEVAA
jgi:hypothetical protein